MKKWQHNQLQKRKRKAMRELRKKAGTSSPADRRCLGDEFIRYGKFQDAIGCFQRALAGEPEDAVTEGKLAYALACIGQPVAAINHYNQAICIDDTNVALHANLGILLGKTGRFEQAALCFEKALSLQPHHPNTLYHLAETFAKRGENDRARDYFKQTVDAYKAAGTRPGNEADDLTKLGVALHWLGNPAAAIPCYQKALNINVAHHNARMKLGMALVELSRYEDAVECYQTTVAFNPRDLNAQRAIGDLFLELGKKKDAIVAYKRVLNQRPDDGMAQYFLSSITQNSVPAKPPEGYVEQLFNDYADNFDEHLVGALVYRAPELLREAVDQVTGVSGAAAWRVMDMGCGTGLCGPLFRDLASHLIGVDLAGNMLEKALARGCYDELQQTDIESALVGQEESLDLVISTDVFIYLGDLGGIFEACKDALQTGGWFGFTVEAIDSPSFVLNETGRYSHGLQYITGLADQFGFSIESQEAITLRHQGAKPVRGYLYILRRVGQGLSTA